MDEDAGVASSSFTSQNNQDKSTSAKLGVDNMEVEMEQEQAETLSSETLKTKMEQESLEFAFLKPICAQVLQNPSVDNLKTFEAALNEVGSVPAHLSEFVAFPFAIHLKVIKTYKEAQRVRIFQSLAKLLDKAELRKSYDMFVNIFQKLHISLALPTNVTTVNKSMSEEETEAIVTCIKNITLVSLSYHLSELCEPEKFQIFGHSIFVLLQLVGPDVAKSIRLKTLRTLEHFVKLCDGSELRSKVLYKFLPGIISSLRKICLPSVGKSMKAIIIKSLTVMGMVIRVSVEYESQDNLEQADSMLSQIVELLSKEFVLNTDVDYRKSFLDFCCEISTRKSNIPKCCKSISSILMKMKEDEETSISHSCVEALQSKGMLQKLEFEDLTNLLNSALSSLNSGNEVACILALREISSFLSTTKLSFVEFQSFLPLLFNFMNEVVWKLRNTTLESRKTADPVYIASCRACQNLVLSCDLEEVTFEFISTLSDLQSSFHSVKNPTGVIVAFNVIVPVINELDPSKISCYEAANLAEIYLSLLDMQSTEVALQSIESDIPAVHSAADIRRFYLLQGLGILGEIYHETVVPMILYPLIEHAGTSFQNSESINEVAEGALKQLCGSKHLEVFLQENLGLILNEINVRMLNLFLYPNCPHAMVFLAQYFDFSNQSFSSLIDQIFERCSDEFGGGDASYIYVKVFYALLKSIFNHFTETNATIQKVKVEKPSLLERMIAYQTAIGVDLPSNETSDPIINDKADGEEKMDDEEILCPVLHLVERICHRLLNFLPNNDRTVKLTTMDSLILGVKLLANHENSVLPLCHSIWQNLMSRIDDRDYVVVRKSFELLQTLCVSSGTFLRKRTIEEAFPKLSMLLINLANEAEQVKDKNRQYYTCTQAYKLQLIILQGLGPLLHSIDVQEFELDKIVRGCTMYLRPSQHKNLREAAMKLLQTISVGKHCRTVWMMLIACGFVEAPTNIPDSSFTPLSGFSDVTS